MARLTVVGDVAYGPDFLKAPELALEFLDEASDDFLRIGLHRMGQLLELDRERVPLRMGVRMERQRFLMEGIHALSWEQLGYSEINWYPIEEMIRLDSKTFYCSYATCRSCMMGLYRLLAPEAAKGVWENTVSEWMTMLRNEKLKQLQIIP